MGRGVWTRRWLAASGGVLVNGLILGALVLIEEPPPPLEEPPVIVLELERPRKRASPHRQAAAGARSAARAAPASTATSEGEGPPAVALSAPSAPVVDPEWRVDPKVVGRWRLLEGNASMGTGRLKRACLGLGNEHMTPEEKEACYNGWGRKADKRPSPSFIGPIDERKWEIPEPKPPERFDEPRGQRCRDYRRGRTPGFAERNLSTGGPPPRLSEGGCF